MRAWIRLPHFGRAWTGTSVFLGGEAAMDNCSMAGKSEVTALFHGDDLARVSFLDIGDFYNERVHSQKGKFLGPACPKQGTSRKRKNGISVYSHVGLKRRGTAK